MMGDSLKERSQLTGLTLALFSVVCLLLPPNPSLATSEAATACQRYFSMIARGLPPEHAKAEQFRGALHTVNNILTLLIDSSGPFREGGKGDPQQPFTYDEDGYTMQLRTDGRYLDSLSKRDLEMVKGLSERLFKVLDKGASKSSLAELTLFHLSSKEPGGVENIMRLLDSGLRVRHPDAPREVQAESPFVCFMGTAFWAGGYQAYQYINEDEPREGWEPVTDIGKAVAYTGVAGGAAYAACTKRGGQFFAKIRETAKKPKPELPASEPPGEEADALKAIVRAALDPNKPENLRLPRFYWVGARTFEGRHTDMILSIEDGPSGTSVTLTGMDYRMPVDYIPKKSENEPEDLRELDEDPHASREYPDPQREDWRKLEEGLLAAHFTGEFGAVVQPVRDVLKEARGVGLVGREFHELKLLVDREVRTLDDLHKVRDLIYEFRFRRRHR